MTQDEYFIELEKNFQEGFELMKRKNSDYGGDDDCWANLALAEKAGICSVETALLVRMTDKVSRIATLLKQEAKVKDESIQDTVMDLMNYSSILLVRLRENSSRKSPSK